MRELVFLLTAKQSRDGELGFSAVGSYQAHTLCKAESRRGDVPSLSHHALGNQESRVVSALLSWKKYLFHF